MNVGTPVTFMGKPLKVYDSYFDLATGARDALEGIDSKTAQSLSLVEEIFNKTDFMNRQITFPGGKTILGSEVFDHISAYHYFQDSGIMGGASAAYSPQTQQVQVDLIGAKILDLEARSVFLGRDATGLLPIETKAQFTIHEIIHGAAHRSGAMPDDFNDTLDKPRRTK